MTQQDATKAWLLEKAEREDINEEEKEEIE